ncbi:MAG: DUF4358 domain-containing protein [Symbiobacteriaceae bacterium]|nr:DUF4358 domain-containing protein [Symbiobacteriaceae bacterium]
MNKVKRCLSGVLLLVLLFPLVACQKEKSIDADALAKQLVDSLYSETMLEIAPERLSRFYPALQQEEFAYIKIYHSAEAVLADELLILQVKNSNQVQRLLATLNEHYTARAALYSDYAPQESDRIQKRTVKQEGRWLVVVICNNREKAVGIIDNAFKGG